MTSPPSRGKSLLVFLFFFLVTWLAAILGMLSSQNAPVIYTKIVQPSWAPPSFLFGPVWTLLYCLMATAAWLVWRRRGRIDLTLAIYLIHLVFQSLWSALFFGWGRADLALIDIVILWAMVVWLTISFWRIDRRAGWLMLPYLMWVTFASALNGALWHLNGGNLPR
jgi:tryptophan-rich sensory protein